MVRMVVCRMMAGLGMLILAAGCESGSSLGDDDHDAGSTDGVGTDGTGDDAGTGDDTGTGVDTGTGTDTGTGEDTGHVNDGVDTSFADSAAATLLRYLRGSFDSERQSEEDFSYYPIRLDMCDVDAPDIGSRVLYVEQAMIGSSPYRQRLYVVEEGENADTQAVSRVFEFATGALETEVDGLCERDDVRAVLPEDVVEKEGCAVYMTWKGDHFEGETEAGACLSDYQGATYTTSEILLTHDRLESWDRGYDAGDQQVWGAVAGPYVFDRNSPLVD